MKHAITRHPPVIYLDARQVEGCDSLLPVPGDVAEEFMAILWQLIVNISVVSAPAHLIPLDGVQLLALHVIDAVETRHLSQNNLTPWTHIFRV